MYISQQQDNCPDLLPSIMMAYRMSPNASTQESPFTVLFGIQPTLPVDVAFNPQLKLSTEAQQHYDNITEGLVVTREVVQQNIIKAQERYKRNYDKDAIKPTYDIGQRVWIDNRRRMKGLNHKLMTKYTGPFYITARVSDSLYKLRRCDNHSVLKSPIHANRLKPYSDPSE